MRSLRGYARSLLGIGTAVVVAALLARVAGAVEWSEPTAQPPGENPPGFVWTRAPSDPPQAEGQFNVAGSGRVGGILTVIGGAVFGGAALDLGNVTGGQNILYGSARRSGMHADDALLLLQTADDATPAAMADRLRVNRDGDVAVAGKVSGSQLCIGATCRSEWTAGTITGVTAGENLTGGGTSGTVTIGFSANPTITGNLSVRGCFGPVLRGRTTATYAGDAGGAPGGYVQANSRCPVGQHVCTTAEALHAINCGAFATAGVPSGTDLWISNLAPSLPTPTNDCLGWTTSSSDWRGIKWRMDTTTGGAAYVEHCSAAMPFACCG